MHDDCNQRPDNNYVQHIICSFRVYVPFHKYSICVTECQPTTHVATSGAFCYISVNNTYTARSTEMEQENSNSNQLTVEVENHGMRFSVTFKYGRLYVYPTPTDVLQLIEIKTAAKKLFQQRLAELELYENNNDYVAICAANFLSNARRVMCFGQGQDGYKLKITYDVANSPRLELYHNERIDALRDQYVLKESLTISYQGDTGGWFIKHIKYNGDKETCVHDLFEDNSPIVADIRKFVNAYCTLHA